MLSCCVPSIQASSRYEQRQQRCQRHHEGTCAWRASLRGQQGQGQRRWSGPSPGGEDEGRRRSSFQDLAGGQEGREHSRRGTPSLASVATDPGLTACLCRGQTQASQLHPSVAVTTTPQAPGVHSRSTGYLCVRAQQPGVSSPIPWGQPGFCLVSSPQHEGQVPGGLFREGLQGPSHADTEWPSRDGQ